MLATQPDLSPERDSAPADDLGEKNPEAERARKLDALGESLAKKRSDAIADREASGIEAQWLEDEEFYQGIDDANRNEHSNAWRTKPPGQYQTQVASQTRSTVFVNITRPYCDAAAARIADMLLPTDDRNWQLRPTPIPDLVEIAKGNIPPAMQSQMAATAGDQAKVDQMVAGLQQQAQQIIAEAKAKAEKAATRIDDWQVEGQWHAEVRKIIENSARIGTGVLKGPVPVRRKSVALVDVDAKGQPAEKPSLFQRLVGGIKNLFNAAQQAVKALIIKEEIKPASKSIDPWNFYPDGACGENIHNGSHTWERDYITPRQLEDLKGVPGYIAGQIDECIKEGPQKAIAKKKEEPNAVSTPSDDKRFEIWYFHGAVGRDELTAAGCECDENENPSIPAMVTMVNNRVIKGALNPLDSGDFPYDVFPWQRKSGMPWGNGVSRQGRTSQRMVNAGARNMMDNSGLSGGPQVVLKQGMIVPADGTWALTPRKLWYAGEDADIDDVRKAMTFFEIPSRQKELMEIVQFGMKTMEDATGLPMLLQGQLGKAPDTVGGMTMLNNNASAVLRRLARTFDDCITEPHIRRYYTWLLQYGEDEEKGDFTLDARGSSALVERDIQSQEISQMGAIVTNPVFGLDPKKWARELLKSRKFDPKNFEFDDEQWQQIVERMGQKPQDPRVAVAQLRAQTDQQLQQLEQQFEQQEADKDRQVDLLLKQVDERIAEIKQNGAKEITFEELKAMLAGVAMKLSTQRELSVASLAVGVHKHHTPPAALAAPTEPAGRAPSGEAFQQ